MWSEKIKTRILSQRQYTKRWQVHLSSWEDIDIDGRHATWDVDPPYKNNERGKTAYGSAGPPDYLKLGSWCQSLQGQVFVHEQQGAEWLPFKSLSETARTGKVSSGRLKKQHEVLWTNQSPETP